MAAPVMLPLDATAGSPSFTAQQTRQAFSAMLGLAPSGRPLGAISGVRPGTPTTTVFMSGGGSTTWNVAAHSGVLDTQTSAAAGPYLYATDGTDTGTITAANGSNPRVDIIYVKVNDSVQDGSGLYSGQVLYLAGTAAASPVAPTVPARGMVLANINVPTAGGGAPTVSWVAHTFGTIPRTQVSVASSGFSVPNNATTALTFDTENVDTMSGWTSGSHVTPSVPGRYLISANIGFANNATGVRAAQIRLNGSTFLTQNLVNNAGASNIPNAPIPAFEYAFNGTTDYIELLAYQNSGGALLTSVAYPLMTFLRVEWCGA